MIYAFEQYELDTLRVELRANGAAVAVEPQVFAVLLFLVENSDRVITKDEIIAKVWGGRIVSDAAIASRIKSARQAIADDGHAQRAIRTARGVGFRFVAEVTTAATASVVDTGDSADVEPVQSSRPSIAVLPFRLVGIAEPGFPIADALPHDLITELSRLHWLFVIARGSSFRFRGAAADLERVRSALNVRYCLTGVVEILGNAMSVSVELSDTHDKGVVWSERFRTDVGAVHEIRDEIVRAVTSAVEVRIPMNEARRAQLISPANLDAWSAYHLGLQHMYRFNKADNEIAASFFEQAIARDASFGRAYAGLSFTHFQTAFLRYEENSQASKLAEHFATQCLERDPLDPFGHLTMGRAHWLRGDLEGSLSWLERANTLNPNYAQARYSRGWAEALLGSAKLSQKNADAALALSPLDPLVYGMLGVKALSHIVLGETAKAADWAERAANAPGAHALIEMIAVAAHSLNADDARAKSRAELAHARAPHLTKDDFLRSFPFRDLPTRARIAETLEKFGF